MSDRERYILYGVPWLVLLLIYLNKDYLVLEKNTKSIDNNKSDYVNKIKELKKQRELSDMDIINLYEKLAKFYKVSITNVVFQSRVIEIKVRGDFRKGMKFFYEAQKLNNIRQFHFYGDKEYFYMNLTFDTKYTYVQNDSFENNISFQNPFHGVKKQTKQDKTIAIIGQHIFHKDKWITQGEEYDGKVLLKVDDMTLILQEKNGTIVKEQKYENVFR